MSEQARSFARVTTLSPLHIGSGARLREGVDFIERDGALWIAHQGALLRTVLDEAAGQFADDLAQAAAAITGMTLQDMTRAGWLRQEHFDLAKGCFRYRLSGRTSTQEKRGELLEQIKDVYGNPYLPGSSLKGALRTVLAIGGAETGKMSLDDLGKGRNRAAQPLEQDLFGRNPNHDLLRALHVGDSSPIDSKTLGLYQVNIYPTAKRSARQGRPGGLDVDVEALKPGAEFHVPIKLDAFLFRPPAEAELRFGTRKNWLLRLPKWCRTVARRRITAETAYYQERPDGQAPLDFYTRLEQTLEELQDNEFLLQLGWGAGWSAKTFGELLQRDEQRFERILEDYQMTMERGRKPGDPFPRSRRLARVGDRPAVPLGWVKITWNVSPAPR